MSGAVPNPASRLYACRVRHERFAPRRHAFAYRLFYLAIDLDDLRRPGALPALLAINRRGVFALRERDYLPAAGANGPATTLKERVTALCAAEGVDLGPGARVTLVTLPRILGYAFNPVSFYFCHDGTGELRAAIAEVTNTYREMKAYFLPRLPGPGPAVCGARRPKHFYVSPFSSLEVAFDFRTFAPGPLLAVRIDDLDLAGGRRLLHSTLTGRAERLTGARLLACLARYPLVTLRVIALIHWHALRLWLKRVPHFAKADRPDLQRGVRRPHASIAGRSSA